jgi:hypothetical protein
VRIRGATPKICIARFKLYASAYKLISVLIRGMIQWSKIMSMENETFVIEESLESPVELEVSAHCGGCNGYSGCSNFD